MTARKNVPDVIPAKKCSPKTAPNAATTSICDVIIELISLKSLCKTEDPWFVRLTFFAIPFLIFGTVFVVWVLHAYQ